jgi:2-polyprenyl-3-methyl-5-hydroxy-6-metoxy-1,4-benzoquinol methylase
MAVHAADMEVPERFEPATMREELLAAEHLARYEWAAALAPGQRVLDAGCGTGYGAHILAAAGAAHVTAVDTAGAVIEAARSHETDRVAFDQADIARLSQEDGSFDLITCFEVIEHVPDPGAVLGELARVLAPGGVLAISSPNADRYPMGNPHHVREFTTNEFRALLAEAFREVRLLAQHQWVSSAVFQERELNPGALTVRTTKAIGRELGTEAYTVALAGSSTLPEPPAASALTGTVEVKRWLKHFDEQQRMLADQADYLANLQEFDAERRELGIRLISAEAELTEARAGLEATRAELAEAHAQLANARAELAGAHGELADTGAELQGVIDTMDGVWGSFSWRCTRPLRGVKSLVRRGPQTP